MPSSGSTRDRPLDPGRLDAGWFHPCRLDSGWFDPLGRRPWVRRRWAPRLWVRRRSVRRPWGRPACSTCPSAPRPSAPRRSRRCCSRRFSSTASPGIRSSAARLPQSAYSAHAAGPEDEHRDLHRRQDVAAALRGPDHAAGRLDDDAAQVRPLGDAVDGQHAALSFAGGFDAWCGKKGHIPKDGGNCSNATGATTVLQMDVAGQLGSAPVGSTPVGSTPVARLRSTDAGRIDRRRRFAAGEHRALRHRQRRPRPFERRRLHEGQLLHRHARRCLCRQRDPPDGDVLEPRERDGGRRHHDQRPRRRDHRRGRLPVGAAADPGAAAVFRDQVEVHYTIGADVDCTVVSQLTFTAHLPAGFFPVDGSAQIAFGNGAPRARAPRACSDRERRQHRS